MWQISGSIAHLSADNLTGSVDLSRPWTGLSLSDARLAAGAQLLGVWFDRESVSEACQLANAHVRASDLIARYAENENRHVRPEFYWRVVQPTVDSVIGLELIASVQTSKLASRPRLATNSRIRADQGFIIATESADPGAAIDLKVSTASQLTRAGEFILLRPDGVPLSYAEMVHPADFVGSTIEAVRASEAVKVTHSLFTQSLEKGVIRRGRVRCAVVPRERDVKIAREHFREFCASEPPLSA